MKENVKCSIKYLRNGRNFYFLVRPNHYGNTQSTMQVNFQQLMNALHHCKAYFKPDGNPEFLKRDNSNGFALENAVLYDLKSNDKSCTIVYASSRAPAKLEKEFRSNAILTHGMPINALRIIKNMDKSRNT